MIEITGHNKIRIFSFDEAQNMLPLIYSVTEEMNKKVKYLSSCLEALPDKKCPRAFEIQHDIDSFISQWQKKISRLGGKPKGMWLIDFDYGQGYYCWKFPETEISFFHGYQDGFTGRKLIQKKDFKHENSFSPN